MNEAHFFLKASFLFFIHMDFPRIMRYLYKYYIYV